MNVEPKTRRFRPDKLIFTIVRLVFNLGDMLLYPDPATAPDRHPEERLEPPIEPKLPFMPDGNLF